MPNWITDKTQTGHKHVADTYDGGDTTTGRHAVAVGAEDADAAGGVGLVVEIIEVMLS